ncbi:MAG TPA: SDR family oxidoreductase [Edaphobacter sp.]|nr:SDR family oxidoreductase [Edaphobacter sp.]
MKRSHLLSVLTGAAAVTAAAIRLRDQGRQRRRQRGCEDRIVLVTGGSRGLGFAIAERFAREGNRLVLTARKVHELYEARNILLQHGAITSPEDALLIPADLTDKAQAAALIEHAIQHFGRIDVLINNAGIMEVGPVENQPLEAYERAMSTNFFAALYVTQAALPHMLHRDPARPAAIVNICSVGGKIAVPHMLPYTASKFALVGFSEGLHAELRQKGIRVTTVCPGLMRTGGHQHAKFVGNEKKEQRWFDIAATTPVLAASVKRAANQIYSAVRQGRAEIIITPQAWLAARAAAVAPESVQCLTSLINEFVLPAPVNSGSQRLPERHDELSGERNRETGAPWNPAPIRTHPSSA